MSVLSIIAFLLLGIAVAVTLLGILSNYKWYWVAGILMYIFNYLAAFSIGLYTLSFTFVLWTLALAHSLGWIKRFRDSVAAVFIGLIIWIVVVSAVDDYWLFRPIGWVFDLFFG
jgi:hypothetical protein